MTGLLGTVHFLLVASGGHVEVVEREGPEGGVKAVADVFPDLGDVQELRGRDDGLHHRAAGRVVVLLHQDTARRGDWTRGKRVEREGGGWEGKREEVREGTIGER